MRLSLWNSATDEQSLKMSLKYPALPFQQRLRTSAAQAWEAPESRWWNNTRRVSLRAPRQKQTLHGSVTAWVGSWHGHKTRLRGTAYICNKYKIATVTSQSGCVLERKKSSSLYKKDEKIWVDNILHLLNPNERLDRAVTSRTSPQTFTAWLLSEK